MVKLSERFKFYFKKASSIIIILILLSCKVYSQGTHYWNQNYGTRSNMIGGLVIGSVEDITAVYYNPGYLGLVTDPELIIGAHLYEYNDFQVRLDNFSNIDLSSSKFETSPSFIGGSFKIDSVRVHKFFYSVLTREYQKTTFNFKHISEYPLHYDADLLTNELLRTNYNRETWVGIAWAMRLNKNLGFGVTNFVAIRNQDYRSEINLSNLSDQSSIKVNHYAYEYSYYNVRLLWKLGIYWRSERFTLGINATTPSINLFGEGYTYFNLAISSSDGREGILASDYRDNLNSFYKNSYSLGFGLSYKIGRSRLHFSTEYFNKTGEFNILAPGYIDSENLADSIYYSTNNNLKSVINAGIGYELQVSDYWRVYSSIFIDQNANVSKSTVYQLTMDMPLYHLTIGGSIKIGKADLTFGLEFSYGTQDFTTSNIPPHFEGWLDHTTGNIEYFRIKGVIAVAFEL